MCKPVDGYRDGVTCEICGKHIKGVTPDGHENAKVYHMYCLKEQTKHLREGSR